MKLELCKIRYLSRLILALVFFTQGILAAHACLDPVTGMTQALSAKQTAMTMHCQASAKLNANECLMHCTQADQVNLDQYDMAALPTSDVALHVVMPPLQHKVSTPLILPLVLNTGPPLSIRFCSFLL